MPQPIVYIDRSRVRPAKLAELREAISDLVALIEAKEPQLVSYGFYFDEDESTMTVVAVHPDAASLELHQEIGASAFRGFAEFIDLESIDVYGEPSERGLEQLRRKAEALGGSSEVTVHRSHEGFARIG